VDELYIARQAQRSLEGGGGKRRLPMVCPFAIGKASSLADATGFLSYRCRPGPDQGKSHLNSRDSGNLRTGDAQAQYI